MAKKLYKRNFTDEDLLAIQNLVMLTRGCLEVEVWNSRNPNADGIIYPISVNSMQQAIKITDNYYNSVNSKDKVVELLLHTCNGITPIYHLDRSKHGLTYEILESCIGRKG